jgi:hypothetical protein
MPNIESLYSEASIYGENGDSVDIMLSLFVKNDEQYRFTYNTIGAEHTVFLAEHEAECIQKGDTVIITPHRGKTVKLRFSAKASIKSVFSGPPGPFVYGLRFELYPFIFSTDANGQKPLTDFPTWTLRLIIPTNFEFDKNLPDPVSLTIKDGVERYLWTKPDILTRRGFIERNRKKDTY